ncbi:sigma-54-dependent Fis family transcriptional regulator [Desulfovibrio sp. ZJ200]|uniref:sigma-54-dependent Fis family transcriptional regulator n=1 Tax=Desulfovibrio sp. ZJ200 TaxID=2709792 RepID=UPI0013EA0AD7|nr:sigma-54-dependent Fis family transcriptional regulator [Desulfovibrio sp. ZJ200]
MSDRNDGVSLDSPLPAVAQVIRHLSRLVPGKMDRNAFFQILSRQLRALFHYDRFCIYLYDSERELLNLFTTADGTVVEFFSNTRIVKNTVAGLAIASRKPVVINDLSAQDFGDAQLPLATVGLNATIALPLILNREVIGTLHVSFVRQPEHVVEILNFLLELSPMLTTFLYAVLVEERAANARTAREQPGAEDGTGNVVLENRLLETRDMAGVMSVARKAAQLQIPVLITGETGTGKSMLARWLHRHSPRRAANFVKVNCPSLAPTLFESEMFGYAKGAFTGAHAKRIGRIEMAQKGTLFLDEIGELSPDMQSKLLQVMEESSFERVGEAVPVGVDIRVLSATNIDLPQALARGLLRRDLFYRLAAVILSMPPLRQRKNDIPLLVNYFTTQFSRQCELRPPRLSKAVLNELYCHDWPGNLRELRNVITKILLHSLDAPVTADFVRETLHEWDWTHAGNEPESVLPPAARAGETGGGNPWPEQPAKSENAVTLVSLEENERRHIAQALRLTGGRLSGPRGAAALLGIPRSTLQHRMCKLGLRPL